MPQTANEHLLNEQIAHQVDLQRYSTAVVRRMMGLLNRADSDLFLQLQLVIDQLDSTNFSVERLSLLLAQVRTLNTAAYLTIERELATELQGLVDVESAAQLELFKAAAPASIGVSFTQIVPDQVAAAAYTQPFRGRLLREWTASLEAERMVRIRDAVRLGIVENETNQQIINRIRGTRANNYADGIIQIDRRNAEAVVRTAVSHVAGATRDAMYQNNADLIKAIVWVSTLDARTTEPCRIRDGLKYSSDGRYKPIGHRVPWLSGPGRLHWRCRSSSVPVMKSWQELGAEASELTAGERASMDGQLPAETTYGQWIKKQSAARQDEILGPTRAKLMREGKLEFDQLYTDRGRPLTLDELRARRPQAFGQAGL